MANGHINKLLEFANMQMAAEAFLARANDATPNQPIQADIKTRLEDGNTRASVFTPVQAEQFTKDYRVLTQFRNDPAQSGETGFSATLFQKINPDGTAGELTLSIRSTEFIDDAVRDNLTNQLEVKELGWTFGQIAELESWE